MGGMTILQRAAMAGRDAHVALLLDHGWVIMIMMMMTMMMSFRVNPTLSTKEQPWRPVLLAAKRGHHRVLAVLATHTEKAAGVYKQKFCKAVFMLGKMTQLILQFVLRLKPGNDKLGCVDQGH